MSKSMQEEMLGVLYLIAAILAFSSNYIFLGVCLTIMAAIGFTWTVIYASREK